MGYHRESHPLGCLHRLLEPTSNHLLFKLREREYLVDLRLRNIDDRTDRRVVAEDEVEADRRVPPELAAVL